MLRPCTRPTLRIILSAKAPQTNTFDQPSKVKIQSIAQTSDNTKAASPGVKADAVSAPSVSAHTKLKQPEADSRASNNEPDIWEEDLVYNSDEGKQVGKPQNKGNQGKKRSTKSVAGDVRGNASLQIAKTNTQVSKLRAKAQSKGAQSSGRRAKKATPPPAAPISPNQIRGHQGQPNNE